MVRRKGQEGVGNRDPIPIAHSASCQLPSPLTLAPHHSPSGLSTLLQPSVQAGARAQVPRGLSACMCSFVQSSREGRGRSAPAFPRLCTVLLLAGSSAGRRRGRQPGTQTMSIGGGGGGGCLGWGCWLALWGLVVIEQCGMLEPECLWGKLVLSGAAWMFPHL